MKPPPLVPAAQEAAVPGRLSLCSWVAPHTPQPPDPTPKAMTVLEIPSFGKKPQKWLSFITHPWSFLMSPSQNSTWRSSCHIRRRKFPLSHQLIPAQAIFRLLLLVLGLSSQSCSSGLQGELLWEPGSNRVTPSLPPGRAQGLR